MRLARIEIERVGTSDLRIPSAALLDDPVLRLEIAPHDTEALAVQPLRPFEIIGQRPGEIAPHVRAPAKRAVQLSEITAHETDAPLIVDRAVGTRPIAERASVLGDIDGNLRVVRRYAKHHLRKRFGDYLPSEIGNFL